MVIMVGFSRHNKGDNWREVVQKLENLGDTIYECPLGVAKSFMLTPYCYVEFKIWTNPFHVLCRIWIVFWVFTDNENEYRKFESIQYCNLTRYTK